MTCPIPRQSQLISAAGRTLPCGSEATVLTAVPGVDRRTGQTGFMVQRVCLEHSILFATWKMIERLRQHERENPRRIIAA